jgi:hypothetical protein
MDKEKIIKSRKPRISWSEKLTILEEKHGDKNAKRLREQCKELGINNIFWG